MYIGKEQPASGGLVGGGMSQDKTASHTFKCGWDGDQENRGAHAADLMRPDPSRMRTKSSCIEKSFGVL